ncbi:MAG: SUF system Fe-S cluster assembly protein [Rhodospirillales bacterium]|nr:SUF system Fe-S cluster assembly protein [Rhodospirillales bacterium]MBI2585916.1 SUF system Fe-S cluster assembly protein [Rhodospirillales bacterium]
MNPDGPAIPDFVPATGAAGGSDFKATAGEPLPEGAAVASEDAVVAALRTVHDPEIPVNIYDLGLIYKLAIGDNGAVKVEMTLTAPGCPVAGEMPGQVANAVAAVEGVGEVEVMLVWEPGWTPERMSADAKLALGMI